MAETQEKREGGVTCYVDDQPVEVDEAELTVRRLLELAGSSPDQAGEGEAILRELRAGEEIEQADILDDDVGGRTAGSRGDAAGEEILIGVRHDSMMDDAVSAVQKAPRRKPRDGRRRGEDPAR